MKNRKYVAYVVVLAVLVGLVYLQFRTWRNFDWTLLLQFHLKWRHIFHGVLLIYFAYFLRAVRWKIFLRPVRADVSIWGLTPPTVIGFTGLALLGRPGELIRPYLIARHSNLTFASQVAVWAVERIFDVGGFTVLLVCGIFLPSKLHAFAQAAPYDVRHWIYLTGYALICLVAALLMGAILVAYRGNDIARWVEQRFSHLAENLGHRIAQKVREFTAGLDTIHGPFEFAQLAAVSVLMWWVIAVSYKEVTTAYGAPMAAMSTTKVLLLMGSSMIGSMVQLPGVGGGSQLATISAMDHVFHIVPKELAVSCGIMLWLVTFVAVVPVGLLLAHRERLSLRKLSAESAQAEEEEVAGRAP
ncbi:MAG TPA: lysylphosphatidylglycerol synthase transmembrane domain-containing protein [Terriglobales bacterium]|nr:lysylphosphatidylglycerol synthase transmembrane domain-containing protein [Terriglobales bacterium]